MSGRSGELKDPATLTLLGSAAPALFCCVLPVVQLHAEGAAQRRGELRAGNLHDIDVTVCGAEITAMQRGHLSFSLFEGGPRPVLQHSRKLEEKVKLQDG